MILDIKLTCKDSLELAITFEYEKPELSTGFKGAINIIDIDVQIPENEDIIDALEVEILEDIKTNGGSYSGRKYIL